MSHQHAVACPLVSRFRRLFTALFCSAILLGSASAQDSASVPNLVKFSGTIFGEPSGSVGVIFALYTDQTGGAPLWQEVQTVSVGSNGHYTSLLGSSSTAGIPLDVFIGNEARWLGVQVQGQAEQPRVLLVSVPYAIKASDAETLGGLPASAFLRADATLTAASSAYVNSSAVNSAAAKIATTAAISITTTATAGYFPIFTDGSGDLGNSALYQLNAGTVASPVWNLGLGTTTPSNALSVIGTASASKSLVVGTGTAGLSTTNNADIVLKDGGGNSVFRGVRTKTGWADQVSTGFFEIGLSGDNVAFAAYQGTKLSRLQLSSNVTQIGGGYYNSIPAPISGDLLELVDGSNNRRLVVQNAGNVGIGTTAPSALLEVNGAAKFDGPVTFASGQTFPGASVSVSSPDTSITVGGTASFPTLALNTSFTNALYAPLSGSANYAPALGSANYVATAGSTMTGSLSLPANGLQMANNQIVTSGGQFGYGAAPNSNTLFDIGGSYTAPTYEADLLRVDGTVNSSYYGQAYLRGIYITPTYNLTQGYANYLTGVELNMATRTGSNVAHSIVGFSLDGQPTGAAECGVGFGIGVPNQQTSLCNGTYGFYQAGGAQYNYFASNVGIGTPFPSALLEVNGAAKFDGPVTFASGQTFPGASVSISSSDSSITVGGTTSAPTLALNTSFTNALYAPLSGSANYAPALGSANYVATAGGTMTGPLSLPANGLQMANSQIVTSGGQFGYGAAPSINTLFDIGGSFTAPTYEADLLRLDGTVNSSYYAQSYLRGLVIYPTFNLTKGYANYLTGVELSMTPPTPAGSVAHSIVGFHVDGQPTGGYECSVGFGINVPNQQTSLCNGVYGFYQGGSAQYNYFASNVGIGTPFPTQALTVQGNVQVNGNLSATGGIQANGIAGAIVTQGTPASSSAACTPPQMMYDSSYVYTCVATNTWRRATSATF